MSNVEKFNRMPTNPAASSRLSSASEMFGGTTAMPRADAPSSTTASRVQELSKP